MPNKDGGFFDQAAEAARSKPMKPKLTEAQVEKYHAWWDQRLMGMPIHQIAKNAGEKTAVVAKALQQFCEWSIDDWGRDLQLAKQKAVCDKGKQAVAEVVTLLRDEFIASGGKGIPSIEEHVEYSPSGQVLKRKTVTKYHRIERDLLAATRELREFAKFEAALDGLTTLSEGDGGPREIEMRLSGGFFDLGGPTENEPEKNGKNGTKPSLPPPKN